MCPITVYYILEEIPILETQLNRNISMFNILIAIINYNSIIDILIS